MLESIKKQNEGTPMDPDLGFDYESAIKALKQFELVGNLTEDVKRFLELTGEPVPEEITERYARTFLEKYDLPEFRHPKGFEEKLDETERGALLKLRSFYLKKPN